MAEDKRVLFEQALDKIKNQNTELFQLYNSPSIAGTTIHSVPLGTGQIKPTILNPESIQAANVLFTAVNTMKEYEQVRVALMGQHGTMTVSGKAIAKFPAEQKRQLFESNNIIKAEFVRSLEELREKVERQEQEEKIKSEAIDLTLPVRHDVQAKLHPISQTIDELTAIFGQMGLAVAEGPDIEDDFHNFTALNIPPEHPARQEHDTFYLPESDRGDGKGRVRMVLRTHTSPVQVRTMQKVKPPIRIIAPGRTYRCDHDATHSPMFHQVEGLVIDRDIHMGHLKGCLIEFCRAFFGVSDLPVRFRPSHFPFTEPSAEVDIGCSRAGGELKIGAGGDWLEILGCGMVHPKVLAHCGIDPTEWQGFAFGMGIERIAMLKYGIPDLRTFYESDLRWLGHYGFVPLDVPSMTGGLTQ